MTYNTRGMRMLHRWCGLAVSLLLVMVALTGAGMVFRPQLDLLLSPGLLHTAACATPLPPSRLVAAARAAYPGAGALSAIRMTGSGDALPVRVRFGDWRWVYVDPCTAQVNGIRDAYGGVFGTLAWLHIFAYAPASTIVAGCVALAAIVLIVAGLMLWALTRPSAGACNSRSRTAGAAPGAASDAASGAASGSASCSAAGPASKAASATTAAVASGAASDIAPGARLRAPVRLTPAARGLRRHRQVALWCAPVLLIMALSGVPQAFPIAATAVPAPALPPAMGDGAATFDAIRPRLDREYPGWRLLQWRTGGAGKPARLEIVEADAPHDYAVSTGDYDPVTGALLQRARYGQSTALRKAYLWGLALHYGAAAGPAWQLAQFAAALMVPFLAWTGVAGWLRRQTAARGDARQQLLLRSKNNVARDVCAFEFVHPRGHKLPAWTAGAHIDVHIAPGLVRQYSLCGDPRDRSRYLIAVHRCTPSRGGSHAMHDALRSGYRITLGMPRNQFALRPGSPHTVLLAGGIGITPLLAMAETLAAAGASFELHYCTRSPVHAAFSERLHQRRFSGRVLFHFSHTSGRADFDSILAAPQRGAQLYICGAAGFMDAAVAAAARQDWPAGSVHTERFSAPAGGAAGDAQAPFDVVVASSGQVVHVAAGRSALAALHAAGIHIPTSCGQGICGTCVTGILEGEPDHRDHCLTEETRTTCFTPCCSRARGERLVLDL